MEKLPKETIIAIANSIFASSDIVASHGTSVDKAKSILATGFNYNGTSMVVFDEKNIYHLCSYGWKETTANVVISIPKLFFKELYGWSNEEYEAFIQSKTNNNELEMIIEGIADIVEVVKTNPVQSSGKFIRPTLPTYFKKKLPREFIRGFFNFCDGVMFDFFLSNPEAALDHLTYIDNPYFYDNLSYEERKKFIEEFCQRKGIKTKVK